MLLTSKYTAVVSSTDLKRKYQNIKNLLQKNFVVIVTNRNNPENEEADFILFPYSENAIQKIDELMEDVEMENNKKSLVKEFEKSYKSGKGKRISLDEL